MVSYDPSFAELDADADTDTNIPSKLKIMPLHVWQSNVGAAGV